jgi:hypothetical protein
MNQTKTNKRSHNGHNKHEAKKSFAPRGPKARVINLRAKGYHGDTLTEHAIPEVKRFYQIIDVLRLGNYKTGFNTYQHGLIIVDGFTINRIADGGFVKVTGTLFGLVKAEDYLRLQNAKGEPALADYVQAVFIEDGRVMFADGDVTKIALTKFKTAEASKELSFNYQGLEQFVAQLVGELFALDIMPQFVKKEEAKKGGKPHRAAEAKDLRTPKAADIRPRGAQEAKPEMHETALGSALKAATDNRRPGKKTSVPLDEEAARDETFALQA